jgi:hypothetical protein
MLPTTALVMYETYFGHYLLSVRKCTLKCQQWRAQCKNFFARSAREVILYLISKTLVPPLARTPYVMLLNLLTVVDP